MAFSGLRYTQLGASGSSPRGVAGFLDGKGKFGTTGFTFTGNLASVKNALLSLTYTQAGETTDTLLVDAVDDRGASATQDSTSISMYSIEVSGGVQADVNAVLAVVSCHLGSNH